MAGILSSGGYDLNTRVEITAPSNNNITLVGNGGADVDVTGINNCIVSSQFGIGTSLGAGHATCICGEGNAVSPPNGLAMGNGQLIGPGPTVYPYGGRIVAMSISTTASSTGTLAANVNGSPTAATISLSAATVNSATGFNVAFSAGDEINFEVTSGSFVNPRGALFIIFD